MDEMPETKDTERTFDPIQFTLSKPQPQPHELAVAFGQLIDGIADLTGVCVERVITPSLSSVTISWKAGTIPSEEWIVGVEEQLRAFPACTGIHLRIRRH